MDERIALSRVIEEVKSTKTFHRLDELSQEDKLKDLSEEEKEKLALLYILYAEESYVSDEQKTKSLEKATTLAPDAPEVWYKRGLCLSHTADKKQLELSIESLEKAILLRPTFFAALSSLGHVLTRYALLGEDVSILQEAEKKFEKASSLLLMKPLTKDVATFYWHRGFLHFMKGRMSEEADDFHKAILDFKKAREQKLDDHNFYNDYGNALSEFGHLLNREQYIIDAAQLFEESLRLATLQGAHDNDCSVRYFNLASCYLYLFYAHFEKHHFALALEYLESTAYEDPYFYKAYAHLGRLYLVGAKLWRDVHCLKESIRNFTKYAHSNKLSSAIVAEWAEALTYLGTHEEDLTLLHQAEELIQKALPFAPDAPHLWYAHGFVLYEQGRYFSDQKFFHLAIEKLEKGLELDPKNGSLWYQLALARFSLAEETENLALAKDALGCFANVKEGMNLRFGSFWNLWGVVLLHVAEETRDTKYALEAERKFEKALFLENQENTEPEWLYNYGYALDFLGDLTEEESYYERAIQVLITACSIDPNYTQARFQLAVSYAHFAELLGDSDCFDKSIEIFQKLIQEDPEDDAAYNEYGSALMNLSVLKENLDREHQDELQRRAEQAFLQALSLGNQQVFYNLACLYSLRKNLSDSFHFFKKAVESGFIASIDDIIYDEWLENVRATPFFQTYLQTITREKDSEEE